MSLIGRTGARKNPSSAGALIEALEDRVVLSSSVAMLAAPSARGISTATALAVPRGTPPARGGVSAPAPIQSPIHLTLRPIDLNLLGLELTSGPINVAVSAQGGNGQVLGKLLHADVSDGTLNRLSDSANSILSQSIALLNSGSLGVNSINTSGPLASSPVATVPILSFTVAAFHETALGVTVSIDPIQFTLTAHSGPGLILGNALAAMANLFNPPLPSSLQLDNLDTRLQQLLSDLNAAVPDSAAAPLAAPPAGNSLLSVSFPGLNLNLLGLLLQTTPTRVDATAAAGSGQLLGNVLTTLNNTLGSTPGQLSTVTANLNAIMAKVVGVLNSAELILPPPGIAALPKSLRALTAAPTHHAVAQVATLQILDVGDSTASGGASVMGVSIAGNAMEVKLAAQTGDGQLLGNLLYQIASATPANATPNTLRAGKALRLLAQLTPNSATQVLNVTLPSLDLNLLGLEVQMSSIGFTVTGQSGTNQVLGNALAALPSLFGAGIDTKLADVSSALGTLVNAGALGVGGVDFSGPLATGSPASVGFFSLTLPANQFNALGAQVSISPVQITLTAHSGAGLILGNALAKMANLFNPPLPSSLDLGVVSTNLQQIADQLNAAAPGIPMAPLPPSKPAGAGDPSSLLNTILPGLNLNLLGMTLRTSSVSINALAQSADGFLLGNILTTLNNTEGATPAQLNTLYGQVNAILAKAIGMLNASTLTVPTGVLVAQPADVLALAQVPTGASPTTPAVFLDLTAGPIPATGLLGQQLTDTALHLTVLGNTGDGQILGNMLYNLANLLL